MGAHGSRSKVESRLSPTLNVFFPLVIVFLRLSLEFHVGPDALEMFRLRPRLRSSQDIPAIPMLCSLRVSLYRLDLVPLGCLG